MSFLHYLINLAQYKVEMDEETHNYFVRVLDLRGLSETSYFEPFGIMGSMYTKTELVDTNRNIFI
jgi:hypothetical protein